MAERLFSLFLPQQFSSTVLRKSFACSKHTDHSELLLLQVCFILAAQISFFFCTSSYSSSMTTVLICSSNDEGGNPLFKTFDLVFANVLI